MQSTTADPRPQIWPESNSIHRTSGQPGFDAMTAVRWLCRPLLWVLTWVEAERIKEVQRRNAARTLAQRAGRAKREATARELGWTETRWVWGPPESASYDDVVLLAQRLINGYTPKGFVPPRG